MRYRTCVALAALLSLAACGGKISEESYFKQAQVLEQNEEYEQAADSYLAIYKRFPSGDFGEQALFRAAIIQANVLKRFEEAIATHDRLLRAFPESEYAPQALFMKGFILANDMKDLEGAKAVYETFLDKYSEHELVSSVKWEISNLGKDINEIEFLDEEKAQNTQE